MNVKIYTAFRVRLLIGRNYASSIAMCNFDLTDESFIIENLFVRERFCNVTFDIRLICDVSNVHDVSPFLLSFL